MKGGTNDKEGKVYAIERKIGVYMYILLRIYVFASIER